MSKTGFVVRRLVECGDNGSPQCRKGWNVQYVMLIAADETEWQGMPDSEQQALYQKVGEWFGEHSAAGKIVGGNELQPVSTATTIRLKGDDVLVTDGPFVESKEVLGGYAVLECNDLDEAIAIAKSWPSRHAVLEVRPVVHHES